MYIKQDMDFNDLMENCWSGAIDTLKTIEENDKEEELMAHLEEQWLDEVPTMTEINDYLWFSDEDIFEYLGISETEEEEEEDDVSNYDCFDDFCSDRDCKSCPLYFIHGDCEEIFNDMKNA